MIRPVAKGGGTCPFGSSGFSRPSPLARTDSGGKNLNETMRNFRLFENEKEKFSSNKTYTDYFDKGASKENVIFRLKVFSSHYLAFFIDSVKIFKIDAKTPVRPKVYKKTENFATKS